MPKNTLKSIQSNKILKQQGILYNFPFSRFLSKFALLIKTSDFRADLVAKWNRQTSLLLIS